MARNEEYSLGQSVRINTRRIIWGYHRLKVVQLETMKSLMARIVRRPTAVMTWLEMLAK